MKETFTKEDLSRVAKSILIIEGMIGETRFRQKAYDAKDINNDIEKAMPKLSDSFGVKTSEEFVDFIKSLY